MPPLFSSKIACVGRTLLSDVFDLFRENQRQQQRQQQLQQRRTRVSVLPQNKIPPSVQKCSLLSWALHRQITGRIQRTSPTGSGGPPAGPKYSMAEAEKPQPLTLRRGFGC